MNARRGIEKALKRSAEINASLRREARPFDITPVESAGSPVTNLIVKRDPIGQELLPISQAKQQRLRRYYLNQLRQKWRVSSIETSELNESIDSNELEIHELRKKARKLEAIEARLRLVLGDRIDGLEWNGAEAFSENAAVDFSLKNRDNRVLDKIFRGLFIDIKFAAENSGRSIAERMAILDRAYPAKNGDPAMRDLVKTLFPELAELEQSEATVLPPHAPALWANDKLPGETPPEFIKKHYRPWIGHIIRPDIKRLDPQLYTALSNWLRKNSMPEDLDLPTLAEKNDRLVQDAKLGKRPVFGEMTAREHGRLASAIQRRRTRE